MVGPRGGPQRALGSAVSRIPGISAADARVLQTSIRHFKTALCAKTDVAFRFLFVQARLFQFVLMVYRPPCLRFRRVPCVNVDVLPATAHTGYDVLMIRLVCSQHCRRYKVNRKRQTSLPLCF